jgi:hypothetical protein
LIAFALQKPAARPYVESGARAVGPRNSLWRKNCMSMMDRETDFEGRYAHDQELRFRIEARRNRLLGLWAAEKLGKSDEEAKLYAQEVVKSDFEKPGDDDVFEKIRRDFDAAGVDQSDHRIRRTMAELLIEAEKQVQSE